MTTHDISVWWLWCFVWLLLCVNYLTSKYYLNLTYIQSMTENIKSVCIVIVYYHFCQKWLSQTTVRPTFHNSLNRVCGSCAWIFYPTFIHFVRKAETIITLLYFFLKLHIWKITLNSNSYYHVYPHISWEFFCHILIIKVIFATGSAMV